MALQRLHTEDLPFIEAQLPQIAIESWSDAARTVLLRGFCKDGTISFDHTTNADRSYKLDTFNVPDVPISLVAYIGSAGQMRGECYVRLALLLAGFPVQRLAQGYLSDAQSIQWPPGIHEDSIAPPGHIETETGTNPAAGAEISETVPTNAFWRLRGIRFTLVSDATVVTRGVTVEYDDGTTVFFSTPDIGGHNQSETHVYSYGENGERRTGTIANTSHSFPLPIMLLRGGYKITTSTANLQAGDDFGAPELYIEEWILE